MSYPNEAEARLALAGVEQARQRVVDRIGMPWWYWWSLAACWIVLGVLNDAGVSSWIVAVVTLAVGAAHASVSSRLLAGRQQSSDVRVRRELAGRRSPLIVSAFLIGLVLVTIAVAIGLDADGAGHPAIWASLFVAVLIVLGGPQMMAAIRRRA
jgi:hypothetical protein